MYKIPDVFSCYCYICTVTVVTYCSNQFIEQWCLVLNQEEKSHIAHKELYSLYIQV